MKMLPHIKKKHQLYYFLLFALLGMALLASLFAAGYPQVQMTILMLATVVYVGVGILHHYIDHTISTKIVIEYVLIGSLGMAVIVFLFR